MPPSKTDLARKDPNTRYLESEIERMRRSIANALETKDYLQAARSQAYLAGLLHNLNMIHKLAGQRDEARAWAKHYYLLVNRLP